MSVIMEHVFEICIINLRAGGVETKSSKAYT